MAVSLLPLLPIAFLFGSCKAAGGGSAAPLSVFQTGWSAYERMVDAEILDHSRLCRLIAQHLSSKLQTRSSAGSTSSDFRVLDLGSGDSKHFLKILNEVAVLLSSSAQTPIPSSSSSLHYTGVDSSSFALGLADKALRAYQTETGKSTNDDAGGRGAKLQIKSFALIESDLTEFVSASVEADPSSSSFPFPFFAAAAAADGGGPASSPEAKGSPGAAGSDFDLVLASFVLHHLDDSGKADCLRNVRGLIRQGGWLVVADVFLKEGHSREEYIKELWEDVDSPRWTEVFTETERQMLWTHMESSDFPSSISQYRQWGLHGGFSSVEVLGDLRWTCVVVADTQLGNSIEVYDPSQASDREASDFVTQTGRHSEL
uniref:Methyltransferase type 12 domain-containing protein n=1 Tax=Chromera velia CCMP2878 TaxID=1169474 RepID=A0A0G4IFV3_9ALVE|eukprot:Cvel_2500.t1-p1 / transcript=Cvel_2500.t1 / gene=Cvel_2500 / organism=Chromera_velia_CCMP2878 / gene_product=hypothetical protein / transcript_product=hypothetical protein / location=Cvel_scaffold98:70344-71456(-) / protein_length=371 / sequence_SO=supercontig / SO=protein_coding / is_pseudo=false